MFILFFPRKGFNFGKYFPSGENTIFIVSWISMSWFISDSVGSFSILVYTLVFPVGVLTLGNISPLEKIHFALFLKSPGHDLSCDPRGLLARIVLSLMIPQTWWGMRRSLSFCSVLRPVSASHLQVHWCMCYNWNCNSRTSYYKKLLILNLSFHNCESSLVHTRIGVKTFEKACCYNFVWPFNYKSGMQHGKS